MDKDKVWTWFSGLPLEECALLLTDHNERETTLLRYMYDKRESAGEGMYLPDEVNDGVLFRKLSSLESMVGGGAIIYPERVKQAERRLLENIRLCDTRVHLDSFTVDTSILEDREAFLHTLSIISQKRFLSSPCHLQYDSANKAWKWAIPVWFGEKGHYTLAEYVTAWLERLIWQRYYEVTRADPRRPTDRSKPYKPSPNASLSSVLDSRKTRLKSFWCGLTEEERKKLTKVKMGSVMASVVSSIEQTDKVDYFKMLKALITFSLDKGTSVDALFDSQLQKDPAKFIEFLYLTPLDRAGKVQDRIMRQIGASLQSVVADKMAMDLIESEKSKNEQQQAKIKNQQKKPTPTNNNKKKRANTQPTPQTKTSNNSCTTNNNAINHSSSNTSNTSNKETSNNNSVNPDNTTVVGKKKKKKKKKGARGDGTMSANDVAQRDPSGKFGNRKHRHSLPLDFGQSADIQKAIAEARDNDEDDGAIVSDSELHEGVEGAKLPVAREIVALDDSDIIEPDGNEDMSLTTTSEEFIPVRTRKFNDHRHVGKEKHIVETKTRMEKEKRRDDANPVTEEKKKQEFPNNIVPKQTSTSNKPGPPQEQFTTRRSRNTSLALPSDNDTTTSQITYATSPAHDIKEPVRATASQPPTSPRSSSVGSTPQAVPTHSGTRSRNNTASGIHSHPPPTPSPPLARSLSSSAPHHYYQTVTHAKMHAQQPPQQPQHTQNTPRTHTNSKINNVPIQPPYQRDYFPPQHQYQRTHYHRDHPVLSTHKPPAPSAKESLVIQALSLPERHPPSASLHQSPTSGSSSPVQHALEDTSSSSSSSPSFSPLLSAARLRNDHAPDWAGPYFPYNKLFPELTIQLHYEMLDYVGYIGNLAREQQPLCQRAIARVSSVVTSIFPKSRVEIFGSFATGLWIPYSDIDLVILNVDYGRRGKIDRQSAQFLLQLLENELAREKSWLQSVQAIPHARVPVIKLVANDGKVPIDITFSEFSTQHTGIAARDLVTHYVTALPALVPLAVVLKTLLRERGLNNTYTGGLSSYCLVLMIISFLKQHYITCPPSNIITESNNWGVLLIRFLEYYGVQFDYQRNGISISSDNPVFPLQFAISPPPFSPYTQQLPTTTHLPMIPPYNQQLSTTHTTPLLPHVTSDPLFSLSSMDNASVALITPLTQKPVSPSISPNTSPLLSPQHAPIPPFIPFQPPPLYVEDPINKGNNVGSHAFSMWRVRAAFAEAFETLTGPVAPAMSLLSRILSQRLTTDEAQ